ncbi:hypothetical protein [Mycobacterium uberis]|uniref:hypothetical protein n=1 Tax=Mycobacterium uberis TaxID=2162698 RepID=UPI001403E15A|nr:hypothetical protein [Mycobacterium uberis]
MAGHSVGAVGVNDLEFTARLKVSAIDFTLHLAFSVFYLLPAAAFHQNFMI